MESLGIERSYQAMADADLTLVVVDLSAPLDAEDEALIARAGSRAAAGRATSATCRAAPGTGRRDAVSALTGEGIAELREAILERSRPTGAFEQETGFITSLRHEQLLRESAAYLEKAARSGRAHRSRTRCCCWISTRRCARSTRSPARPRRTTS